MTFAPNSGRVGERTRLTLRGDPTMLGELRLPMLQRDHRADDQDALWRSIVSATAMAAAGLAGAGVVPQRDLLLAQGEGDAGGLMWPEGA